ncbi:hypothetical protein ILUMI_23344 [Ignelater luminosus]|uniref:TRAFD1/XAF1 zinc finger domain-containing protein n=1 Tax=Ignelater luminosus TaxID=2038154 RepID=A0A8K0CET1_IGNLU|nr:hypothetical protein ILUMI_23344 [Ignelater luminosus]
MDQQVELEICGNCKKEIPQINYVMHTAHCARNIALCPTCKEPIPKVNFEEHKKLCLKKKPEPQLPPQPPSKIEQSKYFVEQKAIQDKKILQRQEKRLAKLEKLVDSGETLGHVNSNVKKSSPTTESHANSNNINNTKIPQAVTQTTQSQSKSNSNLLPCQYCELELPKFDLGEHENYCGARTEKCQDCGELVMFKYRQLHQDTNHGFLKLNDAEPGPRPTWESPRTTALDSPTRRRPSPFRSFSTFDAYTPGYAFSTSFSSGAVPSLTTTNGNGEKLETSKEISRRLDCKTEYIRNLLHDSASITAPLRSTGAVPRHLRHNKGPAPQPPLRRRNPPTELVIPCEFCGTPIPHEELIEHETGCRPDLARFNPRRRSDSPDYFIAPEPSSPDEELPCEFCADLIPASRLLSHQATCN